MYQYLSPSGKFIPKFPYCFSDSLLNIRFDFGRKVGHFRVSKTVRTTVQSCWDISDNLYIFNLRVQGEAWTGTE